MTTSPSIVRTIALIDGLNVHHSIHNHDRELRWYNPVKLSKNFLGARDTLEFVRHYTAFPNHLDGPTQKRYNAYISAIRHFGVEVFESHFSNTKCYKGHKTHEEKQTDVHIAIDLVAFAYENKFDKVLIITADSDFMPAIEYVLSHFQQKKIEVIIPPNKRFTRYEHLSRKYKNVSLSRIKIGHLVDSRMPDYIPQPNGKPIKCPAEYAQTKYFGSQNN